MPILGLYQAVKFCEDGNVYVNSKFSYRFLWSRRISTVIKENLSPFASKTFDFFVMQPTLLWTLPTGNLSKQVGEGQRNLSA